MIRVFIIICSVALLTTIIMRSLLKATLLVLFSFLATKGAHGWAKPKPFAKKHHAAKNRLTP
jgi:hypothetical protein